MAIFDNLKSEVTPTRSIEQPSAFGSVASIIQASGIFDKPDQAAKPTEGERYEAAWGSFLENENRVLQPGDPGYGQWLKTTSTKFVAQNPSFASEQKALLESQGLAISVDPAEAVADKRQTQYIDFFGSNLGMVAERNAKAAATDKNGILNEALFKSEKDKAFSVYVAQQAAVTRIAEESKTITDQKVVATRYWDTGKNMARAVVVQQVDVLSNLVEDIRDGSAVITPQMSEVLGLPPGKITPANFSTLLLKYRPTLVNALVSSVESELINSGADPSLLAANPASEQWITDAMSPIDAVIQAGSDFDTAGEVLKSVKEGDRLAVYMSLPSDIRAKISLAEAMPPEILSQVYGLFANVTEDRWKAVVDTFSMKLTADRPTADVVSDLTNMSTSDARVEATAAAGVLDTGSVTGSAIRNSVVTLFVGSNRADPAASIGLETFKAIGKNAEKINQEAAADPEFKAFVVDNFVSDLNKNYKEFKSALNGIPNVTVSVDERGRITATPATTDAAGGVVDPLTIPGQAEINTVLNGELGQAFMAKIAELDKMGPVGAEAKEAFMTVNGLNMPKDKPADANTPASSTYFDVNDQNLPAGGSIVEIGSAKVVANSSMKPLLDSTAGASRMLKPGADTRLAGLLQGPFQTLQNTFGKPLVINDGLAKDGTSRESETPNSRHFHGDAIDISTAGMSDAEKLQLVDAAIAAGFQGFGFGNNILHVDIGARRAWAYGNSTFGGVSVADLKAKVQGSSVAPAAVSMDPRVSQPSAGGDLTTPEADDNEGAATGFTLFSGGSSMAPPAEANPAAPATATEAVTAELPATFQEDTNFQGTDAGQPSEQTPVVDAEVAALIDNLSSKTKRQLKAAGIEPSSLKFFETDAAAEAAIESGELKEGDAYILPNGQVNIVEGD